MAQKLSKRMFWSFKGSFIVNVTTRWEKVKLFWEFGWYRTKPIVSIVHDFEGRSAYAYHDAKIEHGIFRHSSVFCLRDSLRHSVYDLWNHLCAVMQRFYRSYSKWIYVKSSLNAKYDLKTFTDMKMLMSQFTYTNERCKYFSTQMRLQAKEDRRFC